MNTSAQHEHEQRAHELEGRIIKQFAGDDRDKMLKLVELIRELRYQERLAALAEASTKLTGLYGHQAYQHNLKKVDR
jgi:hypothetical protein